MDEIYNPIRNKIHNTAIIHPSAILGSGNTVGAHTIIENGVVTGNNNYIGSNTIIGGKPEIYKPNGIYNNKVLIGDENFINHQVTIDSSSTEITVIGNKCMLMSKTHMGHDSVLHNNVILSTGSKVGGFTVLFNHVNLGLNAVIHQRIHIGENVMIGMNAAVTKSVTPHLVVGGVPAKFLKKNIYGITKKGLIDDSPSMDEFITKETKSFLESQKILGQIIKNS